jgi:hypothetical protein
MAKRKKMTAEKFNAKHPVGTPCRYFPIKGEPDFVETKTRSEAWELGHGAVVVAVEGRTGGVLIDHLEMREG